MLSVLTLETCTYTCSLHGRWSIVNSSKSFSFIINLCPEMSRIHPYLFLCGHRCVKFSFMSFSAGFNMYQLLAIFSSNPLNSLEGSRMHSEINTNFYSGSWVSLYMKLCSIPCTLFSLKSFWEICCNSSFSFGSDFFRIVAITGEKDFYKTVYFIIFFLVMSLSYSTKWKINLDTVSSTTWQRLLWAVSGLLT